jgi:phospholipase D1/2
LAVDKPPQLKNPLAIAIALGMALTIGLALVWRFTPLREIVTAERVIEWAEAFSGHWWAPLVLILAYTPASVVMFPRQLITIAAAVAFGPVKGFICAMAGVLLASAAGWLAGRLLDEERVKRMAGPRLERLSKLLRKRGIVAVAAARALPVAPFTIESIVAGALRIKLWHLLAGTFLGMAPGMLGTTILGDQVAAALTQGRRLNGWIIAAAVAALAGVAWFARRWFARLEADAS